MSFTKPRVTISLSKMLSRQITISETTCLYRLRDLGVFSTQIRRQQDSGSLTQTIILLEITLVDLIGMEFGMIYKSLLKVHQLIWEDAHTSQELVKMTTMLLTLLEGMD